MSGSGNIPMTPSGLRKLKAELKHLQTVERGKISREIEVARAHGDEFFVTCGGGSVLQILELQPEGRRTMTAREFLAGHGHLEGARFEP